MSNQDPRWDDPHWIPTHPFKDRGRGIPLVPTAGGLRDPRPYNMLTPADVDLLDAVAPGYRDGGPWLDAVATFLLTTCGRKADELPGMDTPTMLTLLRHFAGPLVPKRVVPRKGWLKVSEAAKAAGVDKATISRACDNGRLTCEGSGHARRIEPGSLEAFMDRAESAYDPLSID